MDRDKILIEVYNDTFYRGFASKFYPNLVDEVCSELIVSLCTIPEERLIELYNNNELKYYCIAVIRNMVCNKNSSFYKDNIKQDFGIIDDILTMPEEIEEGYDTDICNELIEDIFKFLKNRSKNVCGAWYDEEIFKMYFKSDRTYRELSEDTKIPTASIYNTAKNTQQMIINKFKDRYNDVRS